MDIANPVAPSYTFFEKYFKVLPEGRIRRYQFFVRFLIPGIIFLICSIFLIPALLSLGFESMILGAFIGNILYVVLFSSFGYALIRKRCHDFGTNGMIAIGIFIANMIASALGGISGLMILGLNINNDIINIIGMGATNVNQYTTIAMLIVFLILLFRPGKKEENKYGKAEYAKVSFLG